MKRITVSVAVEDTYNRDKLRWLKDDMIVAAMERVQTDALDVVAIEAKIGTVRKTK